MRTTKVSLFLARRAVLRGNGWLSITTVFMLILVYLNLVFTPALLEGIIETANSKLRQTLSGDITVQNADSGKPLEGSQSLVETIGNIDGVDEATPVSSISAQLAQGSQRGTAEVSGITPQTFNDVFDISKYMIEGTFLGPNDNNMIVLGAQIAGAGKDKLELYADSLKTARVGDTITVTYANGVKKDYILKGIFLSEFVQADLKAFVTQDEFVAAVPSQQDQATQINVRLTSSANQADVVTQIENIQSGLAVRTWQQRAGFVRSYTDSLEVVNAILRTVALFVAFLTIFIVTLVDMLNKKRQIGILRAIGISNKTIVMSYIFRAVFYTCIGVVIAVATYIFVIIPVEKTYPFRFPLGAVYLQLNYGFLAFNALLLLFVSIISAMLPAWQVSRGRIVDAIWR